MEGHAMVGDSKSSWTVTCNILLEDNIGAHGGKSGNKCCKRIIEEKIKRTYHLQDMENDQMVGFKKTLLDWISVSI